MKILIIEEEVRAALNLSNGLKKYHTIDLAFSSRKGLRLAYINNYDIIIIDATSSAINEINICRELRDSNVSALILIITDKTEVSERVSILDAGADSYLTKPFELEELKARLRALGRRQTKHLLSNLLRVGDLSLETASRTATYQDQKLDLSRKEFALLEYLMRHPGQVNTRAMILEHVWDSDREHSNNTIDVHIKYLRDKIDRLFQVSLIKTIHGVGYTIDT